MMRAPSPTTRRPLLVLAALAALASATPYPRDGPGGDGGLDSRPHAGLAPRDACASPCGADRQYCCAPGEVCATLPGNLASCVPPGVGTYGLYTTTWTETRTYTSTVMTHWLAAPAPTPGANCQPQDPEQQACGPICCAGWQTCAYQGQCSVKPGYAEPSTVVVTSDGRLTTRYSAPFRVTGTTVITTSGLNTPTAAASGPAATTDGSSGGQAIGADGGTGGSSLSPGAIAGIVIGTLAGVALLLLLCFCCIARGLWNTIFGRKKRDRPPPRDRERVDVYEERYARRAGGSRVPSASASASASYARRDRHAGWFGGRPPPVADRREKRSDGRWWLGLAGAAATLLALLNLKKDKRQLPPRKVVSRYSDSYYTYSDATTSPTGSSGSGHRTNYTRRTGDSRAGRSHYSRSSRRP